MRYFITEDLNAFLTVSAYSLSAKGFFCPSGVGSGVVELFILWTARSTFGVVTPPRSRSPETTAGDSILKSQKG